MTLSVTHISQYYFCLTFCGVKTSANVIILITTNQITSEQQHVNLIIKYRTVLLHLTGSTHQLTHIICSGNNQQCCRIMIPFSSVGFPPSQYSAMLRYAWSGTEERTAVADDDISVTRYFICLFQSHLCKNQITIPYKTHKT